MNIIDVQSAEWMDADNHQILAMIKIEGRAGYIPYVACGHDTVTHGKQFHTDLVAGLYGTIDEYDSEKYPPVTKTKSGK